MAWTEDVALLVAKKIKPEDSPYTIGQLSHGIEIFLLNIINTAALLSSSLVFGVFWEVLPLVILFFLHRLLTGGVHLSNPWSCLTATLLLMIAGGFLLKYMPIFPVPYAQILILIGIGTSFFINYRYAPAEHTYVPTNPEIQKRNRFIVLILIGIGCVLSIVLVEYSYRLSITYTLAVLLQSALLLPRLFKLVSRLENLS